ncbi:MAG TPA: DUF3500 domain-containing protein [Bryobacteraceae bacterium]
MSDFLIGLRAADTPGAAAVAAADTTTTTTSTATVGDIVSKALAFEATLTTAQQAVLEQTYTAALARRWSNLPCTNTCRNGIGLGTLTSDQLAAALAVIQAASGTAANQGYDQFNQIRLADGVLAAAQGTGGGGPGGGGGGYGTGLYYLAFLNTPTATGPWMMQFGGHHYGANIAFNNGHIVSATPLFFGLEPLSFTVSGTTYTPLAQEHDAMTAMLASLTTAELATAQLSQTFSDVTMSPGETNGGNGTFPATKVGLAVSTLTADQKALVLAAMKPWLGNTQDSVGANLLATYQSELDGTYIAYTGNGTSGSASSFLNTNTNYVRIDGPSVWIEFICQNGVVFQNQIHYHTVWRDHTRDYGQDLSLTTALETSAAKTTQTISQIADGSGWKSTIILANTGTAAAPFTLRFWNGDGTSMSLPLGTNGTLHEMTGTIAVNGTQTIETDGTATSLSQGWGELISSGSISGTAIFRLQVSGRADSEGSAPVTAPTSERLLLPFDNSQGYTTAAALVNPDSTQSATVQAVFYDESGNTLSTNTITLPAHGQTAFALADLVPATANTRGLADFSSSTVALTGIGLRFSPTNTFTSVEMLPPATSNSTTTQVTQFVTGAGWQTGIMLANTSATPAAFQVRFLNQDGSPATVALDSDGTVQEFSGVIPVHGTRFIQTTRSESATWQGWAEMESKSSIGGIATLGLRKASGAESESVVRLRPRTAAPVPSLTRLLPH